MGSRKRTLWLVVACCIVLAGCITATVQKTVGTTRFYPTEDTVSEARSKGQPEPGPWGAHVGLTSVLNRKMVVDPGSSIVLKIDEKCYRFGPGTHLINTTGGTEVSCDEDEDDEDQDQDQDNEPDRDQQRDQQPSESSPSSGTTQQGVLQTMKTAVTTPTGAIITGAVVGGVLYEHIEDNRKGDPVSP